MRYCVQILVIAAACTQTGNSALLQDDVASDAKWLLHFDLAKFRATQVGEYFVREVLQKELSKPLAVLKQTLKIEINQDKILHQISAITIYGTAYHSPENNSVLLVHTDAELEQMIVGTLAGMALAGSNADGEVKQTQIGNVSFYNVKNDSYFAVQPGRLVAFGKARASVEKAAQVLAGKAPNLTSTGTFSGYADVGQSFFFIGIAEGFNAEATLPPQARLLQLADGGRVVLGEKAGRLFLNLALRAKSQEIVIQMQQVIQGLIALSSLGEPEDEDLAKLIRSIKVSTTANTVGVNVEYPVESVIRVVNERKVLLPVRSPRAREDALRGEPR